ncbi:MAG: peptidylprolyl isomerase [Treponema sp.]|nr:peptidylprolyl isomerase [Treponema sp.]
MKQIAFLSVFFLFFEGFIFAQSDLQTAATVNLVKTENISVKQFRSEVEKMEKAVGQTLNSSQRREVLDAMINERLVLQAAERDKITVTDNEVNKQIDELKSQMVQLLGRSPTDAEFATAVKNQTGLDMPAFRDQLKRGLVLQKYIMTKKQSQFDNIKPPTNQEIIEMYNLTKSQFVRPDTVRFSMVQVPYGNDNASKTKAKALIDQLAREIGTNPSKFDDVVLRGQAPNSGYMAGDGSYLPRNMEAAQIVGQEFINVAFGLKQGEVSRVIEGKPGYQIIKITETYTQKNLELDDIFQPGSRVTVREYIGNIMAQEKQGEAVEKATDEIFKELRSGKTFQVFERNLTW